MKFLSLLLNISIFLFSCASSSTQKRSLAERYYNIATDYYNEENYAQAVAYYKLAQAEDPNLKVLLLNYGLALIEEGDYQLAEQQLKQAHAINSRNTLCLSALGYLKFRSKQYKEAAAWYQQSSMANPYNPQTFYNLGIVQQYIGNYQASQQAFDKVAELQDPKKQPNELRRFAALNQLHLGDEEKAMELYGEYFSERGSNEQIFQDIYDFYSKTQQYDKLQETFRLFEKSLSGNPLASFLLAQLYYFQLADRKQGREHLKNAIERRFRDIERMQNLVKKLKGQERQLAQKLLDSKE